MTNTEKELAAVNRHVEGMAKALCDAAEAYCQAHPDLHPDDRFHLQQMAMQSALRTLLAKSHAGRG